LPTPHCARNVRLQSAEFQEGRGMSRTFHIEIIKPSHYDKDGYVIQWWKDPMGVWLATVAL
jgi:hypothetical protein